LASARRAVALEPDLPLAQAALGRALVHRDLDFRGARTALGRAMAAGGGDAQILTSFALFTGGIGDQAPAIGAAHRAVQLDPLNPRAFDVLGSVLIWGRRYGEAIGAFRQALALNPQRAGAHADIGDAFYLQGRFAEARVEYDREPVALFRDAGEAAVLRRLGDDAGARAAFARLSSAQDAVTAYQQAQVHAQWGQTDEAFRALEEAARRGDTGLLVVKADPLLDPLRGDSRWGALMTRLGLDNID
jgi:serine/threonine-protein kinase